MDEKKRIIRLRRTHRISWMISGWIGPVELGQHAGGTACLAIGCPDDFYAVRLGFANSTANDWTITKAIGCASSAYNDYVNPTGGADWISFTFANAGLDDDRLVTRVNVSSEIRVRGNVVNGATGETDDLAWTWTDWAPISSVGQDATTGMRVLMLRALIPSSQSVCFANSQLRTITGNKTLNRNFDCFIGGLKFNIDKVTDPSTSVNDSTETWQDNQLASGSLFPIVQFLTKTAGIVGATTGDSHNQGTATTEQMTGYLYRATTTLGSDYIGKMPFGMVNCAMGGLTSGQFFPRLKTLLTAVRPSYVVLPGWAFNDRTGDIHADQFAVDCFTARLLHIAEVCRNHGIATIYLTPFPRDPASMSQTQLVPWRKLRQMINEKRAYGATIIDSTALLGRMVNDEFDGTYMSHMSDDGAHPNDQGHSAVASDLISILRVACEESMAGPVSPE
jgi:hypothetical protein